MKKIKFNKKIYSIKKSSIKFFISGLNYTKKNKNEDKYLLRH